MISESNKTTQRMDEAEPQAGWSPTPVLLIGLFALLAYWGMTYVDNHGQGFSAMAYAPYGSFEDVSNAQPVVYVDPIIKRGMEVFKACEACHQKNAMGVPGTYPPLFASDWVNAKSPNRIIRIVLDGAVGQITVNGTSFNNSTGMNAWKGIYTDYDIAAVLTYVRGNQLWKNGAPPVTEAEVKAIRAKVADHGQFTEAELLKVPEDEK